MRKSIKSVVLAVCILLSANSVFALNLYNYTTKEELYLDDEGWSEKGLEGYKRERREEGFIPEDEIPAEDWVTLYSADGRSQKFAKSEAEAQKKVGWYESLAEAKAAAKAQSAQHTAQPKQEQKSSYPISGCYENTRFRTFTNITGISYSDKSSTDTGSTIYNYGYVPEEYIYSYIAALQSDGLTYDGAENYGVSLLLTMRDTNNGAMLIMAYDGFGKTLRISVAP